MRNKELLGAVSIVAAGAALHSAVEATPVYAESDSTVSPKNEADTYTPGEETTKLKNMFTTEPPQRETILEAMSVNGQQKPEFKLGFKGLCAALGEEQCKNIVGEPLENEHWGDNGDSLQQTSKGLMAWRKVDNWTAFTNGSRTWVNGPNGIQERANDERFSWENDGQDVSESKYPIRYSLETMVNGIKYRLQMRSSGAAQYYVGINGDKAEALRQFIAQEGQINGFNKVNFIVLGPDEKIELPEYTWRGYKEYSMGAFGVQRSSDVLDFYWQMPKDIHLNNPDVMENGIRSTLGAKFVNILATGGTDIYNSRYTLEERLRIDATRGWAYTAFNVIPSTIK